MHNSADPHASMLPNGQIKVIGLGDPVMDVLFRVDYQFLSTIAERSGGCIPITHEEMVWLAQLTAGHAEPSRVPGGSAANVLKGMANISSGRVHCILMGMVGADATAKDYKQKLQKQGVQPMLLESSAGPTATCLCFVTPDGQRTMRTCLGASSQLTSSSQLPANWADGATLLHCEGYCLYKPQLAAEVMAAAKKAGALISLDLASFECVHNCKEALLALLQSSLIDLVFANEEEALALLDEVAADATSVGMLRCALHRHYSMQVCHKQFSRTNALAPSNDMAADTMSVDAWPDAAGTTMCAVSSCLRLVVAGNLKCQHSVFALAVCPVQHLVPDPVKLAVCGLKITCWYACLSLTWLLVGC
eukprot:GHRR01020403.1.p1 GENE.GHRR01020403.1~~GHRR01020403.1.p1  ORF type:complete len:362 (+),score=81.26 GHRR01020403.1:226-1311(+)